MKKNIIILPGGMWCLEIGTQRSQPAKYDEPILMRSYTGTYIGMTAYFEEMQGIYEAVALSNASYSVIDLSHKPS